MSDDLRNELARTLALAGDEDGCFVRIDEWEAQEEWEREAHPDEYPASDHEDAEYWRRKADALMPIIERVKAEAKAEALEEAAREWAADPDAWGDNEKDFRNELRDRAAAIRAAAENGEKPARCLSCHEPAVDSGEGRFCGRCQDYEGTCINDHCLTCGATT